MIINMACWDENVEQVVCGCARVCMCAPLASSLMIASHYPTKWGGLHVAAQLAVHAVLPFTQCAANHVLRQ